MAESSEPSRIPIRKKRGGFNAAAPYMLTRAETKRVLQYFVDKWGWNRKCPYCEDSNWSVGEQLVEMQPFGGIGVFLYVVVQCDNCGNTIPVDAEKVGVWPEGA